MTGDIIVAEGADPTATADERSVTLGADPPESFAKSCFGPDGVAILRFGICWRCFEGRSDCTVSALLLAGRVFCAGEDDEISASGVTEAIVETGCG
jgi:hypothetical protein